MSNIVTILNKELKRFFGDPRMLISLILPGILIFVIYSVMGNVIMDKFSPNNVDEYIVYGINFPSEASSIISTDQYNINFKNNSEYSLDELIDQLKEKKIDLVVKYSTLDGKGLYEIYQNSIEIKSATIYNYFYSYLYAGSIESVKYNINNNTEINYDVATKEDTSKMFITMLLPFVLIILLFTGCMSIASESIAGEKERGTIATLLVTPIKRSGLAIGKIFALSITALVSAFSSFLGLIFSLPKLVGGSISGPSYGFNVYLQLLLIIICTVLVFTVLISIVSCFAKSIKEATQYTLPIMLVVMFLGIMSMTGGLKVANDAFFLIPIFNSVQCMSSILSQSCSLIAVVYTCVSNILVVAIGVFILSKMFNNEKIMFSK